MGLSAKQHVHKPAHGLMEIEVGIAKIMAVDLHTVDGLMSDLTCPCLHDVCVFSDLTCPCLNVLDL